MGTRGIIGFRFKDKDYLTYNPLDSYPDGVGKDVFNEVKDISDWDKTKGFVENIKLVDQDKKPVKAELERYKGYGNPGVGGASDNKKVGSWYQLLRKTQGTLAPYMSGEIQHMIDSPEFIKDSLFCEWGYIVNLDSMEFEVWQGFQKVKTENNRYGEEADEGGYYPCTLLWRYKLGKLDMKQFEKDIKEQELVEEI